MIVLVYYSYIEGIYLLQKAHPFETRVTKQLKERIVAPSWTWSSAGGCLNCVDLFASCACGWANREFRS